MRKGYQMKNHRSLTMEIKESKEIKKDKVIVKKIDRAKLQEKFWREKLAKNAKKSEKK